jgi:hypothetical protein
MITAKIVYPSANNIADAPSRDVRPPNLLPRDRLVRKFILPVEFTDVFDTVAVGPAL